MRTLLIITICVLAARLFGQEPAEPRTRFQAVDVFVTTTNAPLAAYQIEIAITNGSAKIVGFEGGEHPAFREPPFYDPEALQRERVVIAAFSLDSNIPSGKSRVARIHLQITGPVEPEFASTLHAAADVRGNPITAIVTLENFQ